ncbi:MAG: hypothetical protein LUD19_04960, partial [Clostridia bacterium]|nr:hypothetical protein [Clostridia bacterium]
SNNAEVDEYCTDETEGTYYTGFVFNSDDDYVTYRKNLAFKWYSDTDDDGTAEEGMFSMTIGFDELSFETFTIKFQSQQYTLTEDGVTINYLTFVSGVDEESAACVYVIAGTEEPTDDDINNASADSQAFGYSSITIEFTGYELGTYYVSVSDGTSEGSYELKNMGTTYSKYVSSSSSTSVIPLTFSASGISDGSAAEMVLYSLNGQSFELSGSSGSMTVTDDQPPVLCLDEEFTTVRYGYGIEFSYAVIDVLATSPSTTINYYILTEEQAAGEINLEVDTEDAEDGDPAVEFTSVSTSDTYAFIDCNGYYGSTSGLTDTSYYGYTTRCLVKIYFTIKDSTASGGTSDDVYIEWYADDFYLETVNEGTAYESKFIRVTEDYEGVSYSYTPYDVNADGTSPEGSYAYDSLEELMAAYQAAVDIAFEEQNPTAGDDNYFYLPSFEGYVTDNLDGYRELTYSIYYIAGDSSSVSSSTSLDFNELSLELTSDGTYRFVIFATDSLSNDMYYWSYEEQEDGSFEWEKITFTSSDISSMLSDAESELWDYVPYFEFSVTYEGLVVKATEAQDIAYVDSEYSADSFDITGLNSGYETSYTLYEFDRAAYTEMYGTISYSDLLAMIKDADDDYATFDAWFKENSQYFTIITALDDLEETDEYYDDYCDYEWDPDSLSFIPQEENTFYVIRLVVKDTTYITDNKTGYLVISSSAAAEELTGESKWLQDNLASVILLAVAGAALIGIILLVVIKPKEKGDIDVIDLDEEDKKTRKKIAKGKKSDKE